MTILSEIEYLGELRTRSTHLRSGEQIVTDAPPDNNGKGAYFSPTDMLANSLGTCMITLMGIAANTHQIGLGKIHASIVKEMASNPRRVSRISVELKIENKGFSEKERQILETAAITCPVAKSIHPDIVQDIHFEYV
ncbi:MAG: OsmC family protein [Flavobacteriales bacterium]|nr:OsmC family protein [Flavobacteriales bacterium]